MRRAIRLIVCLLVLAVPDMALAGPLEDGLAAYEERDYTKAVKSFRLVAEKGNALAQFLLGDMYFYGLGVRKDNVLAYMWYNLAVAGASVPDISEKIAEARENLAKRMTPAQIAEAQRLSREWKPGT